MIKLSCFVSAYSQCTLEESIRRIGRIGFSGVAITAVRPHAYPRDLDRVHRRKIVGLLKSLNLEVSSVIHHGAAYGMSMSSSLESIRKDAVKHMRDVIMLAKQLGSKVAMILPSVMYEGESVSFEDAWKWTIRGLRSCVSLAEKNNIIVAIEPCAHWHRPVIDTIEKGLKALKEIGSENFKLCIDTATLRALNLDVRKTLTDLAEVLGTIHIHVPPAPEKPEGKYSLEKTGIDYETLFQTLKDINYTGYLELETYNLPTNLMDKFLEECKTALEAMLKS